MKVSICFILIAWSAGPCLRKLRAVNRPSTTELWTPWVSSELLVCVIIVYLQSNGSSFRTRNCGLSRTQATLKTAKDLYSAGGLMIDEGVPGQQNYSTTDAVWSSVAGSLGVWDSRNWKSWSRRARVFSKRRTQLCTCRAREYVLPLCFGVVHPQWVTIKRLNVQVFQVPRSFYKIVIYGFERPRCNELLLSKSKRLEDYWSKSGCPDSSLHWECSSHTTQQKMCRASR